MSGRFWPKARIRVILDLLRLRAAPKLVRDARPLGVFSQPAWMTMSRSLVTVVIPSFNQARFLASAILSVQEQRYQPLETIVVDDGSSDETAEVATACKAILIRQANQGVGAARNSGMAAANGEFVIFLDADDELLPNAVESGVAFLETRPDLACVVRRCEPMDVEGRVLPSDQPHVDTTNLYREWLSHNFVWTPGAALFRRRRILAIGGFPTDVSAAADYAVYLTLARSGGVGLDPQPVMRYRRHDEAMSVDPVLMLRETLEVLRRERGLVPPELIGALNEGRRNWRKFYGEEIITRLRRDWRARRLGRWHLAAIYMLLRHCPRSLWTNGTRKLARTLRGEPREELQTTATRRSS